MHDPAAPSSSPAPTDPTRRAVVAGTAAASGLLLAGCAATGAAAAGATVPGATGTLRVGIVGCGGRGTGAAYQALLAEDEVGPDGERIPAAEPTIVLVSMGDAFADRIEASHAGLLTALGPDRANRVDVPPERRHVGFDAYRQVIDECDVVLLTTPPCFRPAQFEYAAEKGVHVFGEKPFGVDAPGVRRVRAASADLAAQGKSVMSGFCWRYNLPHRAFFRELERGRLGDLQAFYSTYNAGPLGTQPRQAGWSDVEWMLRNWHHFSFLSGDHIVEQACHSIDKQSWAFGDEPPLHAVAVGGCQWRAGEEKGNTYDHFSVTYTYSDGRRGFHTSRQWPRSANENNDFLFGTNGQGTIENWTPRAYFAGRRPWEYDGPQADMYQTEHDELFAAIRSGRPVDDSDWMTRSTLLAVMGRTAAYTGRLLTWEELETSDETLGPDVDTLEFGDLDHPPEPVPGQAPPPAPPVEG